MSHDHYEHWQETHYPNDDKHRPAHHGASALTAVLVGLCCAAIALYGILFRT